ncbi:thioesterase II family protein [Micromonospora sp. DT233]|uniref:thioesterase II family protein n=1 Tax=Micromonospora sp. DT233 TaxID=3393432 RepID=UPI003CF4E5B9
MTGSVSATGSCLLSPPDPAAAIRLFCFHHAGGAASSFASWAAAVDPSVSVVPVQLPGREGRVREERVADMTILVEMLEDELGPWLTAPFAFYGHSMGAFLAHALTRRWAASGRTLPRRLFLGAAKAPHLPIVLDGATGMTDLELGRMLVGMGGMSAMVLRYPDWLRPATQLVRDDLRICQSNPYRDRTPVPVPMELFAGEDDPVVRPADVAAWELHAGAGHRLHVVPGGHFFPQDPAGVFLPLLSRLVAADARQPH